MSTENVFQELSTCHILKAPYVSEKPETFLRITGRVLESMHFNSAISVFVYVYNLIDEMNYLKRNLFNGEFEIMTNQVKT